MELWQLSHDDLADGMKSEIKKLVILTVIFLAAYFLPVGDSALGLRFRNGLFEALAMLHEYARDHVLLCLVPAFFIAGAISVFVRQASVIRYFGAKTNKLLSYSVASISGTILAVCSCTVLPLFAGIYTRGAGIGPATAFLYSGPAINVLAIILTARVLGMQLGIARAVGAVGLSVIIGLLMSIIFPDRKNAPENDSFLAGGEESAEGRPLWQEAVFFASMVGILVFANWSRPIEDSLGIWGSIYAAKWYITGLFIVILVYTLIAWFKKDERRQWVISARDFAFLIMPLLFIGVLAAGFLLGRPGNEAIIPSSWIAGLVGGNSVFANLFASIAGALMYFATLTEVPILQGLMGAGMGKGPALALLLAGPTLSLPSMIVIRQIIGTRKMLVFVGLVVALSATAGMIYGSL